MTWRCRCRTADDVQVHLQAHQEEEVEEPQVRHRLQRQQAALREHLD
jgi:hypothetical protein